MSETTHVNDTGEWPPKKDNFYDETQPFKEPETGEWHEGQKVVDDIPKVDPDAAPLAEPPAQNNVFKSNPIIVVAVVIVAVILIAALISSPIAWIGLIIMLPIIFVIGAIFSSIATVGSAVGEVAYAINEANDEVKQGEEYTADDGSEPTDYEKRVFGQMGQAFDDFYAWYRSVHENDELDLTNEKDQELLEIFQDMGIPWPETAALAFKQGRLRVEI